MRVIDGAGATLMPGMVEAHTHFAWNNAGSLADIQKMPLEEHTLWTARVAKTYLDHGWTSCVGAATAKPRLDVVVRNAINEGLIPGPRYLAASQEITVPGGLGDETLPHLPFPEFSFAVNVSGAEDMRRVCRMFLKYGVDAIKINLSGDNLTPQANAKTSWMTDAEATVAVEEARMRGKRVAAHARSCDSIKQAVRCGVEVIYHASFTDNEALDLLEAHKDTVFVAPGLSVLFKLLYEGEAYGFTRAQAQALGYEEELAAAVESIKAMHRRGVRVLPGGDYGFAWAPHGTNAMDLQYFVKHCGMTPMEALVAATRHGGAIMRCPASREKCAKASSPTCCWSTAIRVRSVDPARPQTAARDHEGWRVPQDAGDRRQPARCARRPLHDQRASYAAARDSSARGSSAGWRWR